MKKKFPSFIALALLLTTSSEVIGQANTSLSNLTATSINQNLLPNTDSSKNLGSSTKGWKDIFATGSVYLDGTRFINKSGTYNTFIGESAGISNTTGGYNSAVGYQALYFNTTGYYNTANGYVALRYNTTGYGNVATGTFAIENNTTGYKNTGVGYGTLSYNVTGSSNTALGSYGLYSNSSGNGNTAVGNRTLPNSTTGYSNVAVGTDALYNALISSNNVAIGDSAFYNLGGWNQQVNNGIQSVAVGSKAGYAITNGSSNSYLGWHAGYADNASDNTAIGRQAGWTVANGNRCTYIGSQSGPTTAGFTNTTGIGYNATPTASNQVRIGDNNVTSIGGKVAWSTLSDGRFKKNIKENVPGLSFINMLKPVTYTLDIAGIRKFKGESEKEKDANASAKSIDEDKTLHTGFVAQEVEAIAKKLNYDFDGVDAPKNDKDAYGIRYSEFVVPLVKAVQELSAKNDSLQTENKSLEARLSKLEALMNNNTSVVANTNYALSQSAASLEQNNPNPFSANTTIRYTLPATYTNAVIKITDNSGKLLKQIPVSGSGKGSVQVGAATLAAGAYHYALYINNQLVGTKQMVVIK